MLSGSAGRSTPAWCSRTSDRGVFLPSRAPKRSSAHDGTVHQSTAWLYENRFDDFLGEISYALVEGGVSRETMMQVFLRHALRVLNENPNSIHAGIDDNKHALMLLEELVRQRADDEFLREKVSKIDQRLPIPLGLHLK
jgi:hypothetical protein